jgi:hypothetical protein
MEIEAEINHNSRADIVSGRRAIYSLKSTSYLLKRWAVTADYSSI